MRRREEMIEDVLVVLLDIRDLLGLLVSPSVPVPSGVGLYIEGVLVSDFQLQDNQSVPVAVSVLDAAGNPVAGAQVDAGTLSGTVSDPTVLTLVPGADTTGFTLQATGKEATGVTVTVTGSYQGKALASGVMYVDVVASAAGAIGLTPGTPTP